MDKYITFKNEQILRHKLKLAQEKNRNSKQTYIIKEVTLITLKLPTKKNLDTHGFSGEFY